MLNPDLYEGREQALVKHTFLDTYMPAQIPKVVRWASEFTYVDLFAGPWQSQSDEYSDTSFGIALRCMTEAKAKQRELGHQVKMVAHLVEKDPTKYPRLLDAVKLFPEVEAHCYLGKAETHASNIANLIPKNSFRFIVIDPKGVPDVRNFKCLIEPKNTEVLLNFMFQFANRFASSSDRMPTLEGWLGGLETEGVWRSAIAGLKGSAREAAISERARQALRIMGGYSFAPALTVDETASERPLYKLIYLSRHPVGMRVFRDAHKKALETQANYKSVRKAETRKLSTGMDDMFANPLRYEPGEKSAREITDGEQDARAKLLRLLDEAPAGCRWVELWPVILDSCVVTYSSLCRIVRELRSSGQILIPAWTSNVRKNPEDDYRLSSNRECRA